MATKFSVGARVVFNGSGDGRYPRIYRGTVTGFSEGCISIRDDGWGATSSVAPARVMDEDEYDRMMERSAS